MPVTKSNLSTTANTRLLAALPSKVYLAAYSIMGGDAEARKRLNELARALFLNYFYDEMQGHRFMTEQETEMLDPLCEIPSLDLEDEDWDELVQKFESRGEGNPNSPAYIVHTLADLEANTPAPTLDDALIS